MRATKNEDGDNGVQAAVEQFVFPNDGSESVALQTLLRKHVDGTVMQDIRIEDESVIENDTNDERFSEHTLGPIHSVSKAVVAIVLDHLHNTQQLNIYTQLSDVLLENDQSTTSRLGNATLDQLIACVGGAPRYHASVFDISKSLHEAALDIIAAGSDHPPGEVFIYSFTSYTLAAAAACAATGRTFDALVHEAVRVPLGLDNSFAFYNWSNGRYEAVRCDTNFIAAGGMRATQKQLELFSYGMLTDKLHCKRLFIDRYPEVEELYNPVGHMLQLANLGFTAGAWLDRNATEGKIILLIGAVSCAARLDVQKSEYTVLHGQLGAPTATKQVDLLAKRFLPFVASVHVLLSQASTS